MKQKKIFFVAMVIALGLLIAAISVNAIDSSRVTDAQSLYGSGKKVPAAVEQSQVTVDDSSAQVVPAAVEQATYTDMWMKSNTTTITRSSGVYADALAMVITTRYPSDLAIMFSSEALTTDTKIYLRALVDGAAAQPGGVEFVEHNLGWWGSRSFTFYKSNVPAGNHSVRIQWLVDTPPNWGSLEARSLVIIANGAGH